MVAHVKIEVDGHNGAVVNSVKDAAVLNAIVRGAARCGCTFNYADAAEILFALHAMKLDDRMRLAARLAEQKGILK